MTVSRDLVGTGAMLVRLLGIGARGGLTAETTLLHVLDGVPLLERSAAEFSPEGSVGKLAQLRKATLGDIEHMIKTEPAPVDGAEAEAGEPLCFEFPEAVPGTDQDRLDALKAEAIERELGPGCWSGPSWTPAKGSKADQALDLWSTTRLDASEIATRLGSTPGAIRSIVKKARKRGEPRAKRPDVAPDPIRDQVVAEAKALPLKRDRAILLWQRTSMTPRAIAEVAGSSAGAVSLYLKTARRNGSEAVREGDSLRGIQNSRPARRIEAPMVVDGVGEDCATALPNKSDGIPPAGSNEESGRADLVPDVSPERADEECAEPVVEPSDRPADGTFPAPHEVETPIEMGTVRQDQPAPVSPAVPDTADRPAGPGLEHPSPRLLSPMVAKLAKKTAPDPRLEELLDLYGTTTRQQKDIGAELGLSEFKVSTLIKAARAGTDPRAVAGDAARAALKAAPVQAQAEPTPPSVAATPAASPPAAIPAPGPQPPGDLVALKHDQVLAIDRGWIVGPAGATKGFTLINAVLLLLASGETIPAAIVARKSGVRSAEAVLAQLTFWRDDLARIGVELIKVTATEIHLRRKSGT